MPHQISEECINCGSCAMECSFGAIFKGEIRSYIAPEMCRDCGARAEICPVLAIQAMSIASGAIISAGSKNSLH